ncbi:hypothetical protein IF188_07645 [Microbacterium sp. NEAU-LLC]|uniref:Uncharacterized protein n=1 Tax=Microbacterium helvum TaxID=2773713 RepID=A0ABR8NM92_9MICO|nr:hypothetical protein [Microbacterium helvum]MBD3941567.1 hypothetical protein [Microbacterium helvum]
MRQLLRPAGIAALLIVGALTLQGCAIALPQIAGPAESSGSTEGGPTVDDEPVDDETAADLPFDGEFDGATRTLQWTDPFMTDADYTVDTADDGNGSWSYVDNRTGCVAAFYQGTVTGLEASEGDSALTDEMLALVLTDDSGEQATADDVAGWAHDDVLPLSTAGVVDTRTVTSAGADGTTWLDTARMIGSVGGGIYLGVTCPSGQDATVQYGTLLSDGLAAAVVPIP